MILALYTDSSMILFSLLLIQLRARILLDISNCFLLDLHKNPSLYLRAKVGSSKLDSNKVDSSKLLY